jgi:pimeloyl-ACP methyl ester carboxylesterase
VIVNFRRGVAVVVAGLLIAGCGGDGGGGTKRAAATPAAPPDPVDECHGAGPGWRPLATQGVDGAAAARLGDGSLGIVFADDSDDDPCSWMSEARALAARHYTVAVFRAGGGDESRQAVTAAAALRKTGVRHVVLIGASVGARAVLQAGARHPGGVVGLVALSAERRVSTQPADLLPLARRVRVPVLTVGSRLDPLTTFGRDTRAFDRMLADDRLLLLTGKAHGVELLRGQHGPKVRGAILRFLQGAA